MSSFEAETSKKKTIWWQGAMPFVSIIFGAGLLLLLYENKCIKFSDLLQTVIIPVDAAILLLSYISVSIFMIVIIVVDFLDLFDIPKPKSDNWQYILALSFFHQLRTVFLELLIPGRAIAAGIAFGICLILAGTVSYCLGFLHPLSSSLTVTVAVSFLYALLEFVRYSIHSWLRRDEYSRGFVKDFKRRNRLYTIPYLTIGIVSSIISWLAFGNSELALPVFATLIFTLSSIYLFILEIVLQICRKVRNEPGVKFFESTVTNTAIIFFSIVFVAVFALKLDQRSGLIHLLWACRGFVCFCFLQLLLATRIRSSVKSMPVDMASLMPGRRSRSTPLIG